MGPVTVLSSDAHVFAPPDRWTKRIDGADEIVVEQGQVLACARRSAASIGACSAEGISSNVVAGRVRRLDA
jgi:hypothetical protein